MELKAQELDWITMTELAPGQSLPLVIQPTSESFDLLAWAEQHRDFLEQKLIEHGGLLFRNCNVTSIEQFEAFTEKLSGGLEEYKERSTPRSEVQGKVYTSTEYPANQWIPQHNESSYAYAWPKKIWFYSVIVAETGGETPIADSRKVLKRLDPAIVERFANKKVMYVRNYTQGLDLPWQTVFQTDDKQQVEEYCRKTGMSFEWKPDGSLKTVAIREALAKHPVTGDLIWFNQAHLFHVTSLPEVVRETLLFAVGEENLPRNTYYGDGTPFEEDVLEQIRAAYEAEQISFPWQQGDILMLDNYLITHGRAPYTGARKVVVGMAEVTSERCLDQK